MRLNDLQPPCGPCCRSDLAVLSHLLHRSIFSTQYIAVRRPDKIGVLLYILKVGRSFQSYAVHASKESATEHFRNCDARLNKLLTIIPFIAASLSVAPALELHQARQPNGRLLRHEAPR